MYRVADPGVKVKRKIAYASTVEKHPAVRGNGDAGVQITVDGGFKTFKSFNMFKTGRTTETLLRLDNHVSERVNRKKLPTTFPPLAFNYQPRLAFARVVHKCYTSCEENKNACEKPQSKRSIGKTFVR
jgi:hypothetical protein